MKEETKEVLLQPEATAPNDLKKLPDGNFNPSTTYLSVGVTPLDGSDPEIYSSVVPICPFSFLDPKGRKYNAKMPPPTYLKESELVYGQKSTKAEILKGFEVPTDGGLKCVDQEVLNRQKGVLASLIAQVATCFFQKSGFVRVSLPVRIFEPRSTLDKILDPWRVAPIYLNKAAMVADPVERMKLTIAFALSGLHLAVTQLKPFNPLLGETLEGGLDDGTKIYCEHISHHPPITSFLTYGPDNCYSLSGYYNYKISFSANSLVGTQSGPNRLCFSDGESITFCLPGVKLTGLIMGNRMAYYVGHMRFEDPKNNLKAVVFMDCGYTGGVFSSRKKGYKRDDLEGILYRTKAEPVHKKKKKEIKKMADLNDVGEMLAPIKGSWLTHINIAGQEYWNINQNTPGNLWYSAWPLPSDWRFREDLLWLRRNNVPKADLWKVELEVQQRHDRELRERARKEAEKAAKKKQLQNLLLK
eukprot:TRINITY_DN1190_c0_g1_i1.p3 TRINITY_DN1190_c0_g1~~TRINITY_DN1190_c0_g1_i1.p3  ORF type:complete len:471 (-),score=49.44 TRINITY_DN1190_c0_g1_i1:72-1484(-)